MGKGKPNVPLCSLRHLTLRALLILLMLGYGVSAYASDTKVSIDASGITLANVLKSIEQQTKYKFIYSKETINVNATVTLKVKNMELTTALDKLFASHDISYTIDKKQIILNKKSSARTPVTNQQASEAGKIRITGTITDRRGEPLIGASVTVEGQSGGAMTDTDGNYEIEVPKGSSLLFSYIGYIPETKKADKAGRLDLTMIEDSQLLNEVVVIGYGTMDKKELTSAISHVSEKDFNTISSTDPTMLIQGKVPGVSITNTAAGDPNNTASVQIRGVSSRSAGLGPLIVIDGVPGGSLTNVNPNDIASFDILKDGAASAIYGTRGSNGVILVTTKKGAGDGTYNISYAGNVAWDSIIDELDFMSADDYRNIRLGWGDSGIDLGGNYDWFKGVSRTGFTHKHALTASGGTQRANFRVSADYRKSNGVDLRSSREEYGGRASAEFKSKGGLFNFTANIAPRIIYQNFANWSVFTNAKQANPTTPLMDPENSQLYYNFQGQVCPWNPVELQKLEKDEGETKLIDMDATAKLNLLPLLWKADEDCPFTLDTQLTFADHQTGNNKSWFRPSTSTIAINSGREGEASREYNNTSQYILEWLANFGARFRRNNIKLMLGYSYQYTKYSTLFAENKDFPNDALEYNNLGSGAFAKDEGEVGMSSYKGDNKLISFFGRVSYDYDGKYLMTASLRREGSSKFGPNNKWGNFPAVSVGWRISQEPFMAGARSWLNDLKIRADYGVTGNQEFDDYLSVAAMKGFGYYNFGGKSFQVWGPANNVNPNLKWEKAKNWNVGLDFALFNNRFSGSLNYFNRRTEDLLGYYKVPIPPYLFDETFVNVGTMKNYGFEFDLNVNAVDTRDFGYNFNIVGTTITNKFVDFSNSEYVGQDYYSLCPTEAPYPNYNLQRIEKGQSIGNFYLWKYVGIDSEGEWLIEDKNGNVIKAGQGSEDDRRIVGNGLPKFTMSTTHTFRYKNLYLSLFFRGAFFYDIFNVHDFYYGTRKFNGNVLKKAYSKNFDISPTATHAVTDYFLERGDYFKLDTMTLGYTFDLHNLKYLDRIKLYGTIHNVFTLTAFSGVDPSTYQVNGLRPGTLTNSEGVATRAYFPSTRQFMLGVQIDF